MMSRRSALSLALISSAVLGACDARQADRATTAPADIDQVVAAIGDRASPGVPEPATDGAVPAAASGSARPEVVVWKSPTCGCCSGWVEYLEEEGFEVVTHDTDDVDAVKTELGLVDPTLHSCHTATIDGYVVEGHVPIGDIERLLAERPEVIGISAPGMPMMSPGMGSREPKSYDVIAFDDAGGQELFSRH